MKGNTIITLEFHIKLQIGEKQQRWDMEHRVPSEQLHCALALILKVSRTVQWG